MRLKPGHVKTVTGLVQLGQHVLEVCAYKAGQQKTVMQLGAPARHAAVVRLVPKARHQGAQQQLLGNAHAGVGRHLESPQFQQAQPPGGGVRRIQLVNAELAAVGVARHIDQNIAQGAVNNPGRHVLTIFFAVGSDFAHGDFKLVELVIARFIDTRRLAGGADKHAREQIAQRRVVVPVSNQADQHFRFAQKRAVCRRGTTQHKMVATPGTGVAAIGHELFCRQTRFVRNVIQKLGVRHQLAPVVSRVNVDFNHARVRRDGQHFQARIARWRIAFEHDLELQALRGGFYGGQ